ncbi:MAG: hypothetical protein HN952_01540 [Candidatus Cloacimonetes bacterium]|jgi:hypothetical protein|nr:hypothetical protein [Candidatus Cloacimonadota bacterium]MBT6993617.1 hypothetical protein [Candidatus Cloacimonadota bacterium]
MNRLWNTACIFLIIIISCTQKTNPIGFESEILINQIMIEGIDSFYSFQDSIKNYNNNDILVIENNATTFLKFNDLPDTLIASDTLLLKLKIKHISEPGEELNLKFALINDDWDENEIIWQNGLYGQDILDTFNIWQDSIEVNLDITDFFNNDSLFIKNGLVIFSDSENNFIECYSSESEYKPELKIITETDTTIIYASADTFINSTQPNDEIITNSLIISNICPTRSFLKFSIPDEIIDPQITINKAEIILESDNNYLSNYNLTITPYIVHSDSIESTLPSEEDYEYAVGSSIFENDEISINITPIIQKIISNDYYDNEGIILKSTTENKDFSFINFNIDNIEIKITYTLPAELE